MSVLTIKLDPVALREATAQAIMVTLTSDIRRDILDQSIRALLTPSTDSWRKGKSPIQEAFDQAVMQIAHEEAKRIVSEDATIAAKIKDLLRETADKVISCDTEQLSQRMADAFVSSLRRD